MRYYSKNSLVLLLIAFLLVFANGCKKDETTVSVQETGTVTDIDGNIYKTVKIGNQWWMAENLEVTNYRDGSPINELDTTQIGTEAWTLDSIGAYCIYKSDTSAPGSLYNWYAVNNNRKIAPEGWHIPTDSEWKELEKYLGCDPTDVDKAGWRGTNEGDKLKVKAPEGWTNYDNVWGDNQSGFSALAGSCRLFNGVWGDPGLFVTGFWWTATQSNDENAQYRYLDYKSSEIFRSDVSKRYGMSIRCVKD